MTSNLIKFTELGRNSLNGSSTEFQEIKSRAERKRKKVRPSKAKVRE